MKDFTFDNITKFLINQEVIIIYVLMILSFYVINLLAKKKMNFSLRTLVALVLGFASGLVLIHLFKLDQTTVTNQMDPYIKGFKALFSVIVIPLVATSIIRSFTSLNDTIQLRKIGVKSIAWLLGTTAVATVIGIIFASIFKLGKNFPTSLGDASRAKSIPKLSEVFLEMVPKNVVGDMAANKVIPVIIIAIVISIAIIIEGAKDENRVKPFKDLIESFSNIMFRITKMVLKLIPYGVYVIIVNVAVKNGLSTLKDLGVYILIVYLAMIFHFIFVQLGLITYVAKLNPIQYIKKIAPMQLFAFTTQSSYATLPVTIRTLTKRVGVKEKIAGFVAPLGANVGMNACGGLFPAMVAIFVANAYGVELTLSHYIILILTTTIASIGIAGVPGIATLTTTVVLTSLGLPLEGIGLVIGVDALIDMGRTAINVTGTSVVATLVAKSENEFDMDVFNSIDELDSGIGA